MNTKNETGAEGYNMPPRPLSLDAEARFQDALRRASKKISEAGDASRRRKPRLVAGAMAQADRILLNLRRDIKKTKAGAE